MMFEHLVALEPLNLLPATVTRLRAFARRAEFFDSLPADEEALVARAADADAVLLNLYTSLPAKLLERCPRLRYVGLCCTLYEDGSCNVDLTAARSRGITVTGVSDYGDKGVPEFVVSALCDLLHGFHGVQWRELPLELTELEVGLLGLGRTGLLTAEALRFFGARVSYFSRTPKPRTGFEYLPLPALLERCEVVCSCLNKNTDLLGGEELAGWTGGKLLLNTGLSPSFSPRHISRWLDDPTNFLVCDSEMALGDRALLGRGNVFCPGRFGGASLQCLERLGKGVADNMARFLQEHG